MNKVTKIILVLALVLVGVGYLVSPAAAEYEPTWSYIGLTDTFIGNKMGAGWGETRPMFGGDSSTKDITILRIFQPNVLEEWEVAYLKVYIDFVQYNTTMYIRALSEDPEDIDLMQASWSQPKTGETWDNPPTAAFGVDNAFFTGTTKSTSLTADGTGLKTIDITDILNEHLGEVVYIGLMTSGPSNVRMRGWLFGSDEPYVYATHEPNPTQPIFIYGISGQEENGDINLMAMIKDNYPDTGTENTTVGIAVYLDEPITPAHGNAVGVIDLGWCTSVNYTDEETYEIFEYTWVASEWGPGIYYTYLEVHTEHNDTYYYSSEAVPIYQPDSGVIIEIEELYDVDSDFGAVFAGTVKDQGEFISWHAGFRARNVTVGQTWDEESAPWFPVGEAHQPFEDPVEYGNALSYEEFHWYFLEDQWEEHIWAPGTYEIVFYISGRTADMELADPSDVYYTDPIQVIYELPDHAIRLVSATISSDKKLSLRWHVTADELVFPTAGTVFNYKRAGYDGWLLLNYQRLWPYPMSTVNGMEFTQVFDVADYTYVKYQGYTYWDGDYRYSAEYTIQVTAPPGPMEPVFDWWDNIDWSTWWLWALVGGLVFIFVLVLMVKVALRRS